MPPPMEFFRRRRPAAGPLALGITLGEMQVELNGLDEPLYRTLFARYSPYASAGPEPGTDLRVEVAREPVDYFIAPPASPEVNPVLLACEGTRIRYLGYRLAGWLDPEAGLGQILLGSGGYEPVERAFENYVRVAVAWLAASRGGALVHAASASLRGRGYLFYGPSGAGKSTLSACNRRARVLSDDLSLVLPGANGALDLIGTPFRGTWTGGQPVVGRFPLACGFRIIKGSRAEVREVPRSQAVAELFGSLPFLAEFLGVRPELFERIERSFARTPLLHLEFRPDESYWDAVERAGL